MSNESQKLGLSEKLPLKTRSKWTNDHNLNLSKNCNNSNPELCKTDSLSTVIDVETFIEGPQLLKAKIPKDDCNITKNKIEKKKYFVKSTIASRAREELNRKKANEVIRNAREIPALKISTLKKSSSISLASANILTNTRERSTKSLSRDKSFIPVSQSSKLKSQTPKKSGNVVEHKYIKESSETKSSTVDGTQQANTRINNDSAKKIIVPETAPNTTSKRDLNELANNVPLTPRRFGVKEQDETTHVEIGVVNVIRKVNQWFVNTSSPSETNATTLDNNVEQSGFQKDHEVVQNDLNASTDLTLQKSLTYSKKRSRTGKSSKDYNKKEIEITKVDLEKTASSDTIKAIDQSQKATSENIMKYDVINEKSTSLVDILKAQLFQANESNRNLKKQLDETVDELMNTKIKLQIAETAVESLKMQQKTQLMTLSSRVAEVDDLMTKAVIEREMWRERAKILEGSLHKKLQAKEKKREKKEIQQQSGVNSGDCMKEPEGNDHSETTPCDKKQRTVIKILKTVKKIRLTPGLYNEILLKQSK